MSVIITLDDEIDNDRGDMIVNENSLSKVGKALDVLVTWMSDKPLMSLNKVIIRHTTNECIAKIKALKYKVDINNLNQIYGIDNLSMNDIGCITLRTSKPLLYDTYKKNRRTGSLIIIDEQSNETIGAGMII